MNNHIVCGIAGCLMMAMSGCSSTPPKSQNAALTGNATKEARSADSASFDSVYHSWKGTPYRLGGSSKRGIDCSAFVQVGYSSVFNMMLPRTTGEMAKMGKWIPLAHAEEGDLVFFKTGGRARHVGIYLGNSEFLHASTSRGVIISRIDTPYWKRTFWQVRRIPL